MASQTAPRLLNRFDDEQKDLPSRATVGFTSRMNFPLHSMLVVAFMAMSISVRSFGAEPGTPIELWPNGVPGGQAGLGEEKDTTKPTDSLIAGKRLIRLGNVSKPTITVYRPPADKDTGAAMLVSPGGG